MTLYKYLHPSKLSLLLQNKLLLTPARYLNDPLEFFVRTEDFTDEELKHHFELYERSGPKPNGYEQLSPDLKWTLFLMAIRREEFAAQEATDMREGLSGELGILSLTEEPCNQLMWSHYTESGKGVAVGLFVGEEENRHGLLARPCSFGLAIKVTYSDEVTKLKTDFSNSAHVFCSKRLAWEYEREWRVIKALNEAEGVQQNDTLLYTLSFMPEHLATIIFGLSTSQELRSQIKKQFHSSSYPNVMLQEVFLDWRTAAISLRPVQ